MKKTIAILNIMLAFMACYNENMLVEPLVPLEEEREYIDTVFNVNLTITRADEFNTKATVKSAWADGDVIFIFLKGVTAPKHLEMKYDSSLDNWTLFAKNGINPSDITGAADKKMTAVYLPYGSTASVVASEGNFIFRDITYSGYFLKAELVDYTLVDGVMTGTLNMTAPTLSSGSDKLIHFDISGFTSGHNYKLHQDYVKPITFTSVSADGTLTIDEGNMGAAITGYEDGSMMSFSGILDASAVGNAINYKFSIDDLTASMIYIRDAGTKTLSTSKYIGIGAINNPSVWNAIENVVDLGLSVKWATFNVGATAPEEYGDYFAWGETETYYEAGYSQEDPQAHWKDGIEEWYGYGWRNYKWCITIKTKLTKYCNDSNYGNEGFTDDKTSLDLVDDVAHVKWSGGWHIPTNAEFDELCDNCTWIWYSSGNAEFNGVAGYKITSNVVGYTDRFIFLPAAGNRLDKNIYVGTRGYYWTSSLDTGDPFGACNAWSLRIKNDEIRVLSSERQDGYTIRPVW